MSGVSPINAGNVEPKTPVKSATPIKQQSFAAAEKEEGMSTTAKMIGGAVLVGIGATAAYFLTKGKNKAALEEATKKADEAKKALDELKAKVPDGGNKTTQAVAEAGNKSTQQATDVGNKATDKVVDKANAEVFRIQQKTLSDGTIIERENASDGSFVKTVRRYAEDKKTLVSKTVCEHDKTGKMKSKTTILTKPDKRGLKEIKFDEKGNCIGGKTFKGKEFTSVPNKANTYRLGEQEIYSSPFMFKQGLYSVNAKNAQGELVSTEYSFLTGKKTGIETITKDSSTKKFKNGVKVSESIKDNKGAVIHFKKFDSKGNLTIQYTRLVDGSLLKQVRTKKDGVLCTVGKSKFLATEFLTSNKLSNDKIVKGIFKNGEGHITKITYKNNAGKRVDLVSRESGKKFKLFVAGKETGTITGVKDINYHINKAIIK